MTTSNDRLTEQVDALNARVGPLETRRNQQELDMSTQENTPSLLDEFRYYLDHQTEMVKKYNGKVIVIREADVLGAYESYGKALSATEKDHPLGTFLIQKVSPGDTDHTQYFHSRVVFV